ncbi:MAG: transcription-repair coupling factor [Nitriliruptoraceae bacterium]
MSSPEADRDVDALLDPGVAVGCLASLLRAGRREWMDRFDDDEVVVASSAHPYLLSLFAERAAPLLVLTPRSSDANTLRDGMAAFLGEDRVAMFPAWETLPHERLSPQPSTVGRRLAVLDRLAHPSSTPLLAVVAPVRAALQPMDPRLVTRRPLRIGDEPVGFDALVDALGRLGYSRVPQVETRGEFAVRGGIVDVFPTAADGAARIEFFGDEVESMRGFAVADQRSVGDLDRVVVDPARELVVDQNLRDRAASARHRWPGLAGELERLSEGITFEGSEALAILLADRTARLTDFLPSDAGVVLVDPLLLEQRARQLADEAEILSDTAWLTPDVDPDVVERGGFATPEELLSGVRGRTWRVGALGHERTFDALPWESFRGDIDTLVTRVTPLLSAGTRVVLSTDASGPARRIADVLAEGSVAAVLTPQIATEPAGGRVEVAVSGLPTGFVSEELGLALLGTWDVFGRRRRRAGRRMGARGMAADVVVQLSKGDAVVHRIHGVGRYRGMVTRETTGPDGRLARRDYVMIEYGGGDTLYVPSDQLDVVARYQGGETPTVMTLGGAQWERAKNRVRGAVRDIAAELIRLYAARMHSPGHAFGLDGQLQAELEDSFAHVETQDQLTVVDEIKRDMETPLPMDRLLAGDVGFGKTEVAVRAAGKAAFDGHQVAVLVPTTILAQQHVETFRERFAGFPVVVEELSRFVTPRDRRRVLDGLAAGQVDVVVGTHALLGASVEFLRLGLVIVDEEQRFGVSQKERLKQLRTHVDVLSMSATPIPRTLEMAVAGIRDLSVIETPPEDRQPVHTVVGAFDDAQVALAIRRELLREGQVFYVHNQVDTIHGTASHLMELVDGVRVEVAHGQMDERQLERVMVRFWQREFDVLVCTTIIESGLDVPNANTLIVERADLLGLGQLHQLRGRVGRSSERGYAYLYFPEGTSLTDTAYERLRTIAEHTRLGSGLSIAARDLEIRGAGNVIGAEQSGHVAAVGFDMYAELLREEIADLTGQAVEPEVEIRIDLPVDAHLPDDYIEDPNQRLELYRRIASARDATSIGDVRAELLDRFGAPPGPVQRLLALAALRAAVRRWHITDVGLTPQGWLRVAPVRLSESQTVRLERLFPSARRRRDDQLLLELPRPRPNDLVGWVAASLRELFAEPRR